MTFLSDLSRPHHDMALIFPRSMMCNPGQRGWDFFRFPSRPAKTCQVRANNELSTAKNWYFKSWRNVTGQKTFLCKKLICEFSLKNTLRLLKKTFSWPSCAGSWMLWVSSCNQLINALYDPEWAWVWTGLVSIWRLIL